MARKLIGMSFWTDLATSARRALGLQGVSDVIASIDGDGGILDRMRTSRAAVTSIDDSLSLSTVFRAIEIHAAAANQLAVRVERAGRRIPTPAIVEEPCFSMSQQEWLEYLVNSMWTRGEAFIRVVRAPATARIPHAPVELIPLNPDEVQVHPHRDRAGNDLPDTYTWRGQGFTRDTMLHLKLMMLPGHVHGLGPIQACRAEVQGALDGRDYGAGWMTETGMPEGILSLKETVAPDVARSQKFAWYGMMPDGTPMDPNGHLPKRSIKVLGSGASFSPVMLKPADVQFIESQQFSTTQIARMFGVPASLLLAAVEGGSQTYANIEQDWIGFTRFGLGLATRKIDAALTRILPRGQKAHVSFDGLLRTDTKTRYEAHKLALDAGWTTDDEIRELEGYEPFTDDQRAKLRGRPAPTTSEDTE